MTKKNKTWVDAAAAVDWGEACVEWAQKGATGIGGCCRVGPQVISELRRQLVT